MPPAPPVLVPLASVPPGTRVRLLGPDDRHAEALRLLGLVVAGTGAAPWAVAWRTLARLDDPAAAALREALEPGGWVVVAVATDAPPAALADAMEAAGLAVAAAPAAAVDADGVAVLHGVFRRVDPGVVA